MNRAPRVSISLLVLVLFAIGAMFCFQPSQNHVSNFSSSSPFAGDRKNWAVDPLDPGSSEPVAGTQSLFDELYKDAGGNYHLPGDGGFEALVNDLQARASDNPSYPSNFPGVAIPLGRSIERTAAIDDHHVPRFFEFPRLVVAVNREFPPRTDHDIMPAAKDRLFLGYMEFNREMQIISYNERAGRFEFQSGSNVGPGLQPKIQYVNRNTCISCHQNMAPIFPLRNSRTGEWEETHVAGPIYQKLMATPAFISKLKNGKYLGVNLPYHDLNQSNGLNDASDRANLFSVNQLLWTRLCRSPECRSQLTSSLLEYRLSGQAVRIFEEEKFNSVVRNELVSSVPSEWQNGLNVPNSNLPSRNPLVSVEQQCNIDVASHIYDLESIIGPEAKVLGQLDPNNNSDNVRIDAALKAISKQFIVPAQLDQDRRNQLEQIEYDKQNITQVSPLCNPRLPRQPNSGQPGAIPVLHLVDHGDQKGHDDQNRLFVGLASSFMDSDIERLDKTLEKNQIGIVRLTLHHPHCTTPAGYFPNDKAGNLAIECTEVIDQDHTFRLRASISIINDQLDRADLTNLVMIDRKSCNTDFTNAGADSACAFVNQVSDVKGSIQNGVVKLKSFRNKLKMRARLSNGLIISEIDVPLKEGGPIVVTLQDDHGQIKAAVDGAIARIRGNSNSAALLDLAMNRRLILQAMWKDEKLDPNIGTFSEPTNLPGGKKKPGPVRPQQQQQVQQSDLKTYPIQQLPVQNVAIKPFLKNCYGCHAESSADGIPNFLYSSLSGSAALAEIDRNIDLCAPRIYIRLMAQPHNTGMPPMQFFAETHQTDSEFQEERDTLIQAVKVRLTRQLGADPKNWPRDLNYCIEQLQHARAHK